MSLSNYPLHEEPVVFKGRCDTRLKIAKCDYIWTINNFSLCPDTVGQEMKSPTFPDGPFNKVKWCLELYPGGFDERNKDYASVFLYAVSCDSIGVKANYKLNVLDVNHKAIVTFKGCHFFTKESDWGYKNMIARSQIPNDQLILSCEISTVVDIVHSSHRTHQMTKTHQNSLSKDYQIVFENQEFSDVMLVAGQKEFKAHKVILGARSPVFKAMFLQEMKENMQNRIEILDIDHEVLNEMLRFIYTGEVCNLKNIANRLISAADKYSLESLKSMCEEELGKNISIENAAEILILADLHNASKLKVQTKQYITAYAKEITETSGWKSMIEMYPHLVTEVFCDLATLRISVTKLTEN